jgi:F-type H+-transporting ATPase subunit a
VKGSDFMGDLKPLFQVNLFGNTYGFSPNILIQWIIIILLACISIILTRGLKRIPGKKQSALEACVVTLVNFVKDTMGPEYEGFAPYVGSLGLFLIIMNFTGLLGFEPPTTDYSVALGMALTSFCVIQAYTIKKVGLLHYFTGYGKPMVFMLPMNLLERVLLPVSLSLRLFGNMTAAATIMGIIYSSLNHISWFAQLGLPVLAHMYFDIFDGAVQMVVFTMLTIINLKIIAEH